MTDISLKELKEINRYSGIHKIDKGCYYVEVEFERGIICAIHTKDSGNNKLESIRETPSTVMYDVKTGFITRKLWHSDGKLYRENGLPTEEWYTNCVLTSCYYTKVPEGTPWRVEYFNDGTVRREYFKGHNIVYKQHPVHHKHYEYWENGDVNLPISVYYNHLGKVNEEAYSEQNTLDLPNVRIWDYFGENIMEERWQKTGNTTILHRDPSRGPALIKYHNGIPALLMYYAGGEFIKYDS